MLSRSEIGMEEPQPLLRVPLQLLGCTETPMIALSDGRVMPLADGVVDQSDRSCNLEILCDPKSALIVSSSGSFREVDLSTGKPVITFTRLVEPSLDGVSQALKDISESKPHQAALLSLANSIYAYMFPNGNGESASDKDEVGDWQSGQEYDVSETSLANRAATGLFIGAVTAVCCGSSAVAAEIAPMLEAVGRENELFRSLAAWDVIAYYGLCCGGLLTPPVLFGALRGLKDWQKE